MDADPRPQPRPSPAAPRWRRTGRRMCAREAGTAPLPARPRAAEGALPRAGTIEAGGEGDPWRQALPWSPPAGAEAATPRGGRAVGIPATRGQPAPRGGPGTPRGARGAAASLSDGTDQAEARMGAGGGLRRGRPRRGPLLFPSAAWERQEDQKPSGGIKIFAVPRARSTHECGHSACPVAGLDPRAPKRVGASMPPTWAAAAKPGPDTFFSHKSKLLYCLAMMWPHWVEKSKETDQTILLK